MEFTHMTHATEKPLKARTHLTDSTYTGNACGVADVKIARVCITIRSIDVRASLIEHLGRFTEA